jgi:hypothetical protein
MRFWSSFEGVPKVLWGVGHNSHNIYSIDELDANPLDYEPCRLFEKIGVRDWGTGFPWVPCASCMHAELSKPVSYAGNILAALHVDTRGSKEYISDLLSQSSDPIDVVFNDAPLDVYIEKLRSARAVVTNSYHASYWSTLLKKPVVVVGGGSKIRAFKHRPVMASHSSWVGKMEEAEIYPFALEECRERNLEFCKDIVSSYP